jgi:hypothetical protein
MRNVIERIFGVVKRRFRLLVVAPEYDLRTQAKMVPAICVLHNFIHIHDNDDLPEVHQVPGANHGVVVTGGVEGLGGDISSAERNQASELRDSIAKAMWDSYQYISSRSLRRVATNTASSLDFQTVFVLALSTFDLVLVPFAT